MKRLITKVTVGIIALFICNCSSDYKNTQLLTIDLNKVIQEETDLPVSQFVNSIEYIPLETTSESLISQECKLYVTKDYIIVRHNSTESASLFLLFDKKSGKFIRPIGRLGRGPEEYLKPIEWFYNPYTEKIYANGENSVKTYNLNGDFLESIEKLKVEEPSVIGGYATASLEAFLNIDSHIWYVNNYTGTINKKLIITKNNKEITYFPHHNTLQSNEVPVNQNPIFFKYENIVSFKEKSNDTIFSISTKKLFPRYVLFSGNKRLPERLSLKEATEDLARPKDYFEIYNIFENSNYLFFDVISRFKEVNPKSFKPINIPGFKAVGPGFKSIHNLCIFDKTIEKTFVCINNEESTNSSLIDDINDFLPISPITITDDGDLVAAIQAAEIVKWKTENLDKVPELVAKFQWLEKIDEFDNPVVTLAKCK